MWRRAPTNASKWQMGFNSACKGLKFEIYHLIVDTIFDVTYGLFSRKHD